jgi:hypothetical protein
MNKYEEAIRLVDACRVCDPKDQELWDQIISYNDNPFCWYTPMSQHPDFKRVTDESTQRLDVLMEHLRQTFGTPSAKPYVRKNKSIANKVASPETVEACKQMLESFKKGEELSEAVLAVRGNPPSVPDEIYPIALLRLVMGVYRVPSTGYKLSNFNWLHDTYGHIILSTYPDKTYKTPDEEAEDNERLDKIRARFALEQEYRKRHEAGDKNAAAEWRQYISEFEIENSK